MRTRLEPRLIKERDRLIYKLFRQQKFTMVELGEMFRMTTQQVYYVVNYQKKNEYLLNK